MADNLKPGSTEALFQQAAVCLQQGNLEQAQVISQRLLGLAPDHAAANHLSGLIAGQRGDYEQACRLISIAIKNNPVDPVYHCSLALALQKAGRLAEALTSYDRAIQLKPDYAVAHYNRGIVLRDLGRPRMAIAAFERTTQLMPGSAEVYCDLGYVLKEAGRIKAALQAYEQATRLKPDNPEGHYNLGVVLADLGRMNEALAAYEQAVRLRPDYAEAHNNRGTILKNMGRLEEAATAYQKTIEIRPDVTEVYLNLAFVLKELGRLDETYKVLKGALALDPESDSAKYMLAALGKEEAPAQSPDKFVVELFNGYANRFDTHLVGTLKYEIPKIFFTTVTSHIDNPDKLDILDLGCGTGLCGETFSELAGQLVGIDLSPKMLAKARKRNIYTRLIENDVTLGLEQLDQTFDLVLSGDVFVYIGNLEKIFPLVVKCLNPGGLFAFSIEANEGGEDYLLRETGRYAQSSAYIERLARSNCLEIITCTPVIVRYEEGVPVPGNVFLLHKALASSR